MPQQETQYEVVVIGAGFSGVCVAIQLKQVGINNFHVFEKAADVGGTWRENTYPGVACDVPSHLYSYSFELNPNWSRHYAPGAEIHAYIRDCAQKFGVDEHLSFEAPIKSVTWKEDRWLIQPEEGETCSAKSVVSALGGLHTSRIPDIPGANLFHGPIFHTAEWQHDLDLRGKRVGVVGTGATAVQVVPELAELAAELVVFQRSPVWVSHKQDPEYSPEEIAAFKSSADALQAHRQSLWEDMESMSVALHTPGSRLNQAAEKRARETIRASVSTPEIADLLTPDHDFACKRPTISSQYYQAYAKENVTLVTGGVDAFSETTAISKGQSYELDVVVFATGFKPFDITTEIEVTGLRGLALKDAWRDQVCSYKSVMMYGFPNFFLMMGPNSTGLQSSLEGIERQANFAVSAITRMQKEDMAGISPRKECVDAFTRDVQNRFKLTTHGKGCTSWWNETGINHSLWPGSTPDYEALLSIVDLDDFHIL